MIMAFPVEILLSRATRVRGRQMDPLLVLKDGLSHHVIARPSLIQHQLITVCISRYTYTRHLIPFLDRLL